MTLQGLPDLTSQCPDRLTASFLLPICVSANGEKVRMRGAAAQFAQPPIERMPISTFFNFEEAEPPVRRDMQSTVCESDGGESRDSSLSTYAHSTEIRHADGL